MKRLKGQYCMAEILHQAICAPYMEALSHVHQAAENSRLQPQLYLASI